MACLTSVVIFIFYTSGTALPNKQWGTTRFFYKEQFYKKPTHGAP